MKSFQKTFAVVAVAAVAMVCAGEEAESFGKWRISVGGAFNSGVRSHIGVRNVGVAPAAYQVPTGRGITEEEARTAAQNHEYGVNGHIYKDNKTDQSGTTEHWKLPENLVPDALIGSLNNGYDANTGFYTMYNSFEYVAANPGPDVTHSQHDSSSDECQFGVAAELSRELWIHDEPTEDRWGLDFAAALSYFFERDIYKMRGEATRHDLVGNGYYKTTIDAKDTMYSYLEETDSDYKNYAVGGFYGADSAIAQGHPAIIMDKITVTGPTYLDPVDRTSSNRYSARGDYRELEFLFMLRPWYELTDWWRVYGEVGVGVSWGRFDSRVSGVGVSHSEDFDQWDVYGVAGLGTVFRYGDFDISLDFIGRFLRDDMDIDGQFVDGHIERADWGLRLMVGYEF